jgi:hypothetical protein
MVAMTSEDPFDGIANDLVRDSRILWDMDSLIKRFDPLHEYTRKVAEGKIKLALYKVGAWHSPKTRVSKSENKVVWVIGKKNMETWSSKSTAEFRAEWERFAALPGPVMRAENNLQTLAAKKDFGASRPHPI